MGTAAKSILSVAEAAEYARTHTSTVYRWVKRGNLVAARSGARGNIRINKNDLDQVLGIGEIKTSPV